MGRAPHAEPLERLIEQFHRLPGIGRRTAERLAYHILHAPEVEAMNLARAIRNLKKDILHCSQCGTLTEMDPCRICADPRRDRSKLCVVELPHDVAQIEKTGAFNGLYHVLMGHVSPLDGIEPRHLRIKQLVARVKAMETSEIVLATNPNVDGDHTALHVREALERAGIRDVTITEPARGIPPGAEIEFVDQAILGHALRSRKKVR